VATVQLRRYEFAAGLRRRNKTELQNPTGAGRVTRKNEALDETKSNTDGIMTALKVLVDPATVIAGRRERSQALKEVEGFFALIALPHARRQEHPGVPQEPDDAVL